MQLALMLLLSSALQGDPGAATPTLASETLELEITAADPQLAGIGPAIGIERVSATAGRLFLWATSAEVDPVLALENPPGPDLLDDDSGGGTTAFLQVDMDPGALARIRAACKSATGGSLSLELRFAAESDATYACEQSVRALLAESVAALRRGESDEVRRQLGAGMERIVSTPGGADSRRLALAAWELGSMAIDDVGDLPLARQAREFALQFYERFHPPTSGELQGARGNLAVVLKTQGELGAARDLEERVVDVLTRTVPDTDGGLLTGRMNLANTLEGLGDLPAARHLHEQVLAVRERVLPPDHVDLLRSRGNLAGALWWLGDYEAARALQEQNVAAWERLLPECEQELFVEQMNLALTLSETGEHEQAAHMQAAALERLERRFPDDHPKIQRARMSLALTLDDLGDRARALELLRGVVATMERTLPPDHAQLLWSRLNLAILLGNEGDLAGKRALEEQAVRALQARMSAGHPVLLTAQRNLAWTLAHQRDAGAARALAAELAAGVDGIVARALLESPRQAEALALQQRGILDTVLAMATGAGRFEADPELLDIGFGMIESVRGLGLSAARLRSLAARDPELEELRGRAVRASRQLVDSARADDELDRVLDARRELDQAWRDIGRIVAARTGSSPPHEHVRTDSIRRVLQADQAAVGYWARMRWEPVPDAPHLNVGVATLTACVLRADGRLAWFDLGPLAEIQRAADEWRAAILAPRLRGVSVADDSGAEEELRAGSELRRRVFDPLLPALEGASRVDVALDDALNAIPLDALPGSDGRPLGATLSIGTRCTLSELLVAAEPAPTTSTLVLVGGVDFDASEGSAEPRLEPEGSPRASEDLVRAGAWEPGFPPLPFSRSEVLGIAELHASAHGAVTEADVTLLVGGAATPETVAESVPGARFVHIASHGWFAPESVRSHEDGQGSGIAGVAARGSSRAQRIAGLSPLVLCGLALAGANRSESWSGALPGVITAEEIATWDLAACELAVLSACDTNVGIRRAGQGVASLQRALHMAGARSVITSLWKVPDEATQELMVDLYRRLWVQGKPGAQALWEAKMRLRDARDAEGRPRFATRDWAGWVLSGDTDRVAHADRR